jgi:hypothetical protein
MPWFLSRPQRLSPGSSAAVAMNHTGIIIQHTINEIILTCGFLSSVLQNIWFVELTPPFLPFNCTIQPNHLHHLIVQMIDHLGGDAAVGGIG